MIQCVYFKNTALLAFTTIIKDRDILLHNFTPLLPTINQRRVLSIIGIRKGKPIKH